MTRFTSLLQSRCIVTLRGWLLGVHNVTPVTPSTAVLAHVPFVRTNSTAAVPEEPLYDVDGSHLSKTQVLAMDPVDRSIAAWRILVDWELKKLRPYVMVDPYDPSGLLYLPYHEYVVTMRTLAAARATIILVCRPETQQPKPVSSPKTPPLNEIRGCILDSDLFVPSWRAFTSLREWIRRNINIVAEKGMVKVDHGNVVGLVNLWGRELLHILAVKSPGTKVEGLLPLAEHLQTLLQHCGTSYTIKRMKIYLFVLNSFIGGNPVATTEPFGLRVRLRNGLPAFLARSVRDSLRSKNLDAVRLYASLFSLYKAIEGPHKLSDLSTIEAAPLDEESAAEVLTEFSTFVEDRLLKALPLRSGERLPGWKYETGWGTVISSAGANSPHAMCSILMDAYAWSRSKVNHAASLAKAFGDKKVQTLLTRFSFQGSVLVALNGIYQGVALGKPLTQEWAKNWGGLTVTDAELESVDTSAMADGGGYDKVPDALWLAAKRVFPDRNVRAFDDAAFLRLKDHYIVASPGRGSAKLSQIRWIHFPWTPVLGRLHSIPEAAGKVRVVAICDYFTQILCKPIHQFLFKVLAIISTDGTFDQQAAVDSFAKEGHQEIYSYDLTAATDMIPLQLYSIVVGRLIGKDLAQKWVKLLSDRDFLKPRDHLEEMKELGDSGNRFVRYSRGQPMGALSSWAGLAIVHHAIILFAADKANLKSSQVAYRVLGDDVIIAGSALALSYRAVCESFGIPIGDYKSYKSKSGLFNFASQTLLGIENVSAVSFKELVQATTWAGRVEMARRILHRYGSSRTSLFRLGVFAPMWQLLTAELSGAKPLHFVRFVRFVLRNPFLVKGDEEIRIDDLLSWLGEISPVLGLVSNEQRNEFESAFKRVLVASICKRWNYLFTGTKKVHGWKEGLKLASPYSEYGGGMELHYMTQCYTGQNKRFYQKALRMYRQVTDGLWMGGGAALSLKKIELLSITQLVKVFVYLSSVPNPVWFVRPNGSSKYEVVERVLFDTIGRKDPDEPEGSSASPGRPSLAAQAKTSARATESLRGPTLELTSLVARVFGKVVPVPEVAGLQFSNRWWRHISSALELNIARRAEATASLHLGQVALVPYGTEAMEMVILASPGCYAVVPWNPYPGNRQWC